MARALRRNTQSPLLVLVVVLVVSVALCALAARAGEEEAPRAGEPPAGGAQDGTAKPAPDPTTSAETAAAGHELAVGKHPETYLEFAVAGGWLMVPIGVCSIVWFAFLVERLVVTRRSRVLPAPFLTAARGLSRGAVDLDEARAICDAHPSVGASVLRAALDSLDRTPEELDDAVNRVAQLEIHRLRRNVRAFSVIAGIAPLIGLLGTVTGMIQAFREVAIQGLGSGQALAPGIYQALITTAGGLLVAIPALLTYHWLMSRVDSYVRQLDDLVAGFVDNHRRHAGRGPTGEPRGGAVPAASGASSAG
jgi:biopolymer transport protein ExbB